MSRAISPDLAVVCTVAPVRSPGAALRCNTGRAGVLPTRIPLVRPDATADYTVARDQWSAGNCSSAYDGGNPYVSSDRRVTTLAGWSVVWLRPTFLLRSKFSGAGASIDSIVLYDPGSYADHFEQGRCGPRR